MNSNQFSKELTNVIIWMARGQKKERKMNVDCSFTLGQIDGRMGSLSEISNAAEEQVCWKLSWFQIVFKISVVQEKIKFQSYLKLPLLRSEIIMTLQIYVLYK